MSHALDKSTYIAIVGLYLVVCLYMLLMTDCSAAVVLLFGLNAYCVGDIILLSSHQLVVDYLVEYFCKYR